MHKHISLKLKLIKSSQCLSEKFSNSPGWVLLLTFRQLALEQTRLHRYYAHPQGDMATVFCSPTFHTGKGSHWETNPRSWSQFPKKSWCVFCISSMVLGRQRLFTSKVRSFPWQVKEHPSFFPPATLRGEELQWRARWLQEQLTFRGGCGSGQVLA